jgi:hypothetical protein
MNSDCFISIVLLENELKELKQKEQTEEVLMLSSYCERELEIMKHIVRNGIQMFGCTIEEFKEMLSEKPNVLLLSDEDVKNYNKALRVIELVKEL